jgi:predicted DNA-binding protein with PD1-like motif
VKHKKDSNGWLLRFESGERLRQTFTSFLADNHCNGWINGIGGVYDPELSHFNTTNNAHRPQVLPGFYEVLSLSGYVALSSEGVSEFHMHGSFGDEQHRAFGGHVFDLTVGPTLQLFICWIARPLQYITDPATGVQLLDLRPR